MNINKKSWMVRLIMSTYGMDNDYYGEQKLPKSLCTFFWVWLSAVILFPFCYPFHIVNYFKKKENWLACSWVVISFVCWLILGISMDSAKINIFSYGLWMNLFIFPLISGVSVCICLGVVVGIVSGIAWLVAIIKEKIRDSYWRGKMLKQPVKEKNPSIMLEWIKAKKRKICPLINYTEGK